MLLNDNCTVKTFSCIHLDYCSLTFTDANSGKLPLVIHTFSTAKRRRYFYENYPTVIMFNRTLHITGAYRQIANATEQVGQYCFQVTCCMPQNHIKE